MMDMAPAPDDAVDKALVCVEPSGRLRAAIAAGRCRYMFTENDVELARASMVGSLIHEAIGLLAAETLRPTVAQILGAANASVDQFPQIEGRAHRQNIAAGTASYFSRLLPPPSWIFHGTEVHLGHGRLDLLWTDFEDRILIDEVKTGHSRALHLRGTRQQVDGYRACAVDTWGDQFLGVRLLSTADPYASLFINPDGSTCQLFATSFVRTA